MDALGTFWKLLGETRRQRQGKLSLKWILFLPAPSARLANSWHWWRTAQKEGEEMINRPSAFTPLWILWWVHLTILKAILFTHMLYWEGLGFEICLDICNPWCSNTAKHCRRTSVITSLRTARKQSMNWCSEWLIWSLEDLNQSMVNQTKAIYDIVWQASTGPMADLLVEIPATVVENWFSLKERTERGSLA